MPFKSIYVVKNGKISFFFMAEKFCPICMYIYHIFTLSYADEQLGCLHILAIINNISVSIDVHVFSN